jgi:hypothetical protein
MGIFDFWLGTTDRMFRHESGLNCMRNCMRIRVVNLCAAFPR